MKENENFNEMTKMTDYCGICHAELVSASFQQTDTDKTLKQVQGDRKNAFTLAETLITLSILGIVAAITVPALVGRQIESQNRTKLKKAMTMYEKAINNMLIENDLQTETAFQTWAKTDATTNSYQEQLGYFKIAEMSTKEGATNCRFKTADRIWWDICGTNDSN
ncbi:type II secretion system protein, partial [bacterium]|nr:type II secretion system protein [bacterium]